MTLRRAVLALSLALGCSTPKAPVRDNHCSTEDDCTYGATCNVERGLCTLAKPDRPYSIVLVASGLPRAQDGLERFTTSTRLFSSAEDPFDINVPRGVPVRGSVRGSSGKPIHAEVTFTPKGGDTDLPPSVIVAQSQIRTRSGAPIKDGEDNLSVSLAPNTDYSVRVVPLGQDSRAYPPKVDTVSTKDPDPRLNANFEELVTHKGRLIDEDGATLPNENVTSLLIRAVRPPTTDEEKKNLWLLDEKTVRSSTETVENGSFELELERGLSTSRGYLVQIGIDPQNPWQTVLAVEPDRIDTSAGGYTITLPRIPKRVRFEGRVEADDRALSPIAAELIFESTFPLPRAAGDLRNRDWCSSSVTGDARPPATCASRVRTSSDALGTFVVDLLPGDYKVIILPSPDNAVHVKPTITQAVIQSQPDNRQQGTLFTLGRGPHYTGVLVDEDNRPFPNVVLRALALQEISVLGEAAGYNRSAEAITRDDGTFDFAIDVGFYDIATRAGDGYPWMYAVNASIAADARGAPFNVRPPVLLSGTVRSGDRPAPKATVDAYAIVPAFRTPTRPVFVGRAVTDAEGRYTLLMPPEIVKVLDRPSGS